MTNAYCTYADLQEAMPDVTFGATYHYILSTLADRASRLIDGFLKREPGAFYVASDTTRYFTGDDSEHLYIGELAAEPTSIAVAEAGVLTSYTAWSATDYFCWPYNALLQGDPYIRIDIDMVNGSKYEWPSYPKCVKVIGKFGFSTTPPDEIKQATVVQAMRWFKRGQQAYQDAGAVMELGQLQFVQKLDPDLQVILSIAKFQRVTI